MKLKEFICDAVNQICDAVIEVSDDVAKKTNNHPIAPARVEGVLRTDYSLIDFEISTTVREEQQTNGEIKSEIIVISVNGNKNDLKENQIVTKIKFSLPVLFQALKKPK